MKSPFKSPAGGNQQPRRPNSKFITTRSGNTIKVKRSIGERYKERADAKARRKAERLRGLPKSRLKRIAWRLKPKNLWAYWSSKDGRLMALKVLGIGIIVFFLTTMGVFAYFRKDLPNLKDISGGNIGGSIRYYDKTGQVLLWEDYGAVKRIPVEYESINQDVKDATIAIEDREFYAHRGFNTKGIFRAGINNVFGGEGTTQGGSTITQQLVKLTQDWTRDRSYQRKVKELILAVELERSYSKNEILTGYLNVAPYGGIEYGVEAAAQNYFNKSAKDLTLDEAAFLASIPKSPRYYSPYSQDFDRPAFIGRQHYVLDSMYDMGSISNAERDAAKKVDTIAKVKPRLAKYDGIRAPYFVLAAKDQLVEKYVPSGGEGSAKIGGWKVTTTLDLHLQNIAEEEVNKGMKQVQRQRGNKAAFVAEDVKTGQVVAMVGGQDFNDKTSAGEVNFATRPIPPGSSFKPYDYAALIENTDNFGAGAVLYDTQGPLEGYPCTNKARPKQGGNCLYNYDFRYPGPLTIRYALGGSRNVPAVKAMLIAGVDKTIQTAEKLGLKSGYKCYEPGKPIGVKENETQCYSSSAIGDGAYLRLDEHVDGFATLSRNGVKLPQTYILKIEDAAGKTIDEWKPTQGEQAVRPETGYIISDILSDPRASYFSRKPHNYKGHKFSLKTGTTNDTKDGLLMGYSTLYSAGVWVGHSTGNVQMSGFMENMTEPIWGGWMRRVHDNLKPEERQKPAGLQTLPAFVVRSHVGVGSQEPSPSQDIYPAWYKKKGSTSNKRKVIDRVSNKLATDCTPERARQEISEGDAESFSGDILRPGGIAGEEKDDIHKCDDIKPSVSLGVSGSSGSYTISATVAGGTHAISSAQFPGTLSFFIDGQPISNCSSGGGSLPGCSLQINSPGSYSVSFSSNSSGSKTISAIVVDSVLYDGSNSVNVSLSGGGLSFTKAERGGGEVEFEWTGGNGPYTVSLSVGGFLCSSGGFSCTYNNNLPVGTPVKIEDDEGNVDTAVVTN